MSLLIPEIAEEEREALWKAVSQVNAMSWPIIELLSFFSLPKEKQVDVLPILESKQKYDFPDGDFITGNSLAVLLFGYDACLNSICLRLLCLSDDGFEEMELIAELRSLVLRAIEVEPPWWEEDQNACISICALTQIPRIRDLSNCWVELLGISDCI